MNLFVDASVALAACGRPNGASRAIFDFAVPNGWILMVSPYVMNEVLKNLAKLPQSASFTWEELRLGMVTVRDVWTMDRPVVFGPAKDRPVLFTAAAWAQTLLTLDQGDFGGLMQNGFYGLEVMAPSGFLIRERTSGRLK